MALLSGEEARRSRNYKAGKLRELSNLEGLTTLRREALKTAGVVGRTGLTVAKGVGRAGLAVGGLLRDKLLG